MVLFPASLRVVDVTNAVDLFETLISDTTQETKEKGHICLKN